jgi:hypothetical protein
MRHARPAPFDLPARRRGLPLALCGAWLSACQGGEGVAAPEAPAAGPASAPAAQPAPAAAPAPTAPGPSPSADGLPDLHAGVATGLCEEIRGSAIPGADSYFFGELVVNGTAVSGTETWALTANSAWKAKGGGDCSIEWRLVGSRTHTAACAECDYGLALTSTPLLDKSDCVEDLKKREGRAGKINYDIKLQSDGTALVYFAGSGKLVGEGYHKDGALRFRSAHQCKWF